MDAKKKKKLLIKRKHRVRKKIFGTSTCPRVNVYFSNKNIHAQCIDDEKEITLTSLSSLNKKMKNVGIKSNMEGATKLGKSFVLLIKSIGIKNVVFDRGIKKFHGKVAAFANELRKELKF